MKNTSNLFKDGLLILVLLIMAIIAIAVRDSAPSETGNSYIRSLESDTPSLAEIPNKSNEHSFSSVNVAGKRIMAVDEMGHRYFYVYDAQDRVTSVVDQNGLVLWRAASEAGKVTK